MKKKFSSRLFLKNLLKKYLRLNIAKKLMLGYLPLVGLVVLTAVFALINLERLISINESIIKTDIPLITATEKMIETIYSQELSGNRYIILQSPQMMELFEENSKEFITQLNQIKYFLEKKNISTSSIYLLHHHYNALFQKRFNNPNKSSVNFNQINKQIINTQRKLITQIKEFAKKAGIDQSEKTYETSRIGVRAFWITAILCFFSLLIGIIAALIITRNISNAISKLKTATEEISKGNFNYTPSIHNQDELGDLSHAFLEMASRLKRLEEMYLDASPLTHLPGSVAIDNILKKRIKAKEKIAFCLVDLDYFKAYNDRYGYVKGNEVIRKTGKIVEEAIKINGNMENFIGHIGGDDFVVITSPEDYRQICNYIIEKFDKEIKNSYNQVDVEKGYISAKTRKGKKQTFPIMSISIAVVTNENQKMHYVEFGERTAELKEYAKSQLGSLYITERRENYKKKSAKPFKTKR